MQPEYRKVIADGDLILQEKGRWWPFFGDQWYNYRNESEEVRLLKQHMDNAFMKYKELQRLFVIAQANVQYDLRLLQMHQTDNSDAEYRTSVEQSILEERHDIKYKFNNGNGKGNGGGSNQNQNQNGNGNQQSKKQRGQHRKVSLLQALLNAELVVPNQQQQVS